jgi:hypothetical protein
MSSSEMRTRRPNRCAGSAPESIRRRTVRSDVFKSSAVSPIVRSWLIGRRSARELRLPPPATADLRSPSFGPLGAAAGFVLTSAVCDGLLGSRRVFPLLPLSVGEIRPLRPPLRPAQDVLCRPHPALMKWTPLPCTQTNG